MIRWLACIAAGLRWRVSWLFVALSVPLGIFIGGYYMTQILYGPATYVLTSTIINETVYPGSSLRFRITPTVSSGRQCSGYIIREFARLVVVDGQQMWEKHRESMTGPPIPTEGETQYVITVPLPSDVEPGTWTYKGRTTFDCGFLFGGIHNYDTKTLTFTVRPR